MVPLADLASLAIPGSLVLLFVRKKVVLVWTIFAIVYLFISLAFLYTCDTSSGMFGSQRGDWSFILGIALSVITAFWAITHTLILRHKEKKAGQTMIK